MITPVDTVEAASIGARIGEAIRRAGLSQNGMGRELGVSATTVSRWVLGENEPPYAALADIARRGRVSVDWIMGLAASAEPEVIRYEVPVPDPPEAWEGFKRLPLQGWAAAGEPLRELVNRADTRWYAFRDEFIYRVLGKGGLWDPERMLVLKVASRQESMRPTIRPHALVVVDRGPGGAGVADLDQLRDGKVYVCQPGEEGVTVKRVTQAGEGLILSSDNQDRLTDGRLKYPPRFVRLADVQLQKVLIGRVVWIGQEEE